MMACLSRFVSSLFHHSPGSGEPLPATVRVTSLPHQGPAAPCHAPRYLIVSPAVPQQAKAQ
jgi:hypothetical protein